MIKSTRSAFLFALALVMTLGMNVRAFADIYSVSYINVPGIKNIVSINDYGDYTVLVGTPLNPGEVTYYADGTGGYSTTAPTLRPDPSHLAGSDPCAITTPGLSGELICNNGHVLLEGEYIGPDGTDFFGLWSGPDPVLDLVSRGYFQGGIMSANGNALLIDPQNDTFYLAIDKGPSPVPEPSFLILLGTGALSMLGFVRRKKLGFV
jgi:hypothetical protein